MNVDDEDVKISTWKFEDLVILMRNYSFSHHHGSVNKMAGYLEGKY